MSEVFLKSATVSYNEEKKRYEILFHFDDGGSYSATYFTLEMLNDTKNFPFYLDGVLNRLIKFTKEGHETPSST